MPGQVASKSNFVGQLSGFKLMGNNRGTRTMLTDLTADYQMLGKTGYFQKCQYTVPVFWGAPLFCECLENFALGSISEIKQRIQKTFHRIAWRAFEESRRHRKYPCEFE